VQLAGLDVVDAGVHLPGFRTWAASFIAGAI